MTVPTRRFWLLVAAGIPIAGLSASLDAPLLGISYNLFLVLLAWGTSRLAPSIKELRVWRQHDQVLSVRTANRITLFLENDGAEPLALTVRDEPPESYKAEGQEKRFQIQPGQRAELSYAVTPPERGSDEFRGTFLRLQCPLGLVERQVKLETEETVRVYPNVLALREFDLLKQQGRLREMGIRRSRSRGLGTEFESLRQYTEGDDYRKIDWKATARKGELVVRNFEQERNQSIVLVLDMGRHMLAEVNGVRKLDHVLDAILMLTHAAAAAGDFVGVLVYSDTVRRYIPPRKGRAHLGLILEACHDLVAEPVESDPVAAMAYMNQRWKRRSLVIGFTDYEDPDRARDLVRAFSPVAHRHLAVLCRVLDPHFKAELQKEPVDLPSMYRQTAAQLLMEDRRAGLSVVESAGIRTLDAEPQDLAASLVSFYFRVKEKNLL